MESFLRTAEFLTGIQFESRVRHALAADSMGFPYYVHQVALRSVYASEDHQDPTSVVTWEDMEEGVRDATRAALDHLLSKFRRSISDLTVPERTLLAILLEAGAGYRMTFGQLNKKAVDGRAMSQTTFNDAWASLRHQRGLVFLKGQPKEKATILFVEPLLAPFLRQILQIQNKTGQLFLFE